MRKRDPAYARELRAIWTTDWSENQTSNGGLKTTNEPGACSCVHIRSPEATPLMLLVTPSTATSAQ